MIRRIPSVCHEYRAQREVDARGESRRGDDDLEAAGFSPRLDEQAALFVGQAAVVEADALAEQAIQVFAGHITLGGGELGAVAHGEAMGDIAGNLFCGSPAGCEDEDRPEVREDALDNRPSDRATNPFGLLGLQGVQPDLLEGHRPPILFDQRNRPSEGAEPFGRSLRVSDAAAQEE